MRKTAVLFSACGACVIAHPHLKNQYQEGGAWVENYVETISQAVTAQGAQASSTATAAPTIDAQTSELGGFGGTPYQGKYGVHGQKQGERWGDHGGQDDPDTSCSSSLTIQSSTTQAFSPSPFPSETVPTYSAPPVQNMPKSIDDSVPISNSSPTSTVDSPSAVSTGSSPGASNQSGGSAADWAQAPNSQGVNILAAANKMRKAWMPNTTEFQWSPQLAANARLTAVNPNQQVPDGKGGTAPSNEVGATVMNHHLYDCSSSQCIASGDAVTMNGTRSPFESAFRMWICEIPAGEIEWPCDSDQPASGGPEATGHAAIIEGDVDLIGCYYMDAAGPVQGPFQWKGLWTCDFAKSGGQGNDCSYMKDVPADYTGASTQGSSEYS